MAHGYLGVPGQPGWHRCHGPRQRDRRGHGPGGPLADSEVPEGEQDATRAMFGGNYGMLRNPAGHRPGRLRRYLRGRRVVQTVGLLTRVLDRIESRLLATARTTGTTPPP